MIESQQEIAGLRTTVVEPQREAAAKVVILHGYAMQPADLSPFARSMNVPATFYFPRAPLAAHGQGFAWWALDIEARARALETGPRDLYDTYPVGREAARSKMQQFLQVISAETPSHPLAIGGFSQGGMLACELVLYGICNPAALMLLSASRLAIQEWQPRLDALRGLPALVSHGRLDRDLAYAAGERLRDMLLAANASVTWIGFDQGHEIPLPVWRGMRRFLENLIETHRAPPA